MFRYIDLCVDMKQGRKCKDALINYRNTCQQVNVGSLEDVIKYLIKTATDKAEDAQKAAQVCQPCGNGELAQPRSPVRRAEGVRRGPEGNVIWTFIVGRI